ncbi:MAG: hypothetical protein HY822_12020 [Acidobacteria bacterium]|nr:hypothetical protein [Acidobacteriota bacterium]
MSGIRKRGPDLALLAVAVFGIVNAVLYCHLLPLWEGFDEPFHYGYVQTLAVTKQWPALGQTRISQEIWRSLGLAPASHVVRRNLPFVTTFAEFAALPGPERRERREELNRLPADLREVTAGGPLNYEAQQSPLAYIPLALADHLWRGEPLISRVVKIRLTGALAAVGLQLWLTLVLARQLGLAPALRAPALFLLFSCQMFYATTAHVANDWLAVPLTTLVVTAALRFYRAPDWRSGALLGLAVAAGLLTKAYFLAWALFAAGLVAWLLLRKRASWSAALATAGLAALAAPWYLRNLLLYDSLSGMLQSAAGLGPPQVIRAALELPWPQALLAAARGAIWTGNSSFNSFSSNTVDAALLLLAAAGFLWLRNSRKPEWLVAAGGLTFLGALLYVNALFYAYTKGGIYTATPWYPQTLAAPLVCLLCLGLSRAGRAGRWIGCALLALSAYLIAATYVAKLIPMYGGYGERRLTALRLVEWYATDWKAVLAGTAPGDTSLILKLTTVVVILSGGLCLILCRRFFPPKGRA